MLAAQLQRPVDPEKPDGMTKLDALAERVLEGGLKGKDDDALATAKFLTSYTDGQPHQYIEFDMRREAYRLSEGKEYTAQQLIDGAEEIDVEMRDALARSEALRDDALSDDD